MVHAFQGFLTGLCGLVLSGAALAQEQKPSEKPQEFVPPKVLPTQAALEHEFASRMTGIVLVGYFTVDDQTKPPKEERYEISKATKVEGNDWLIQARVKFGDTDVNVPIKLQVYWADDTPVMSLDELTIPTLGTFSSRVLFHGDRYVGTWQHGKVGGHMYGRLEKATPGGTSGSK
jgi:hypothetical protein